MKKFIIALLLLYSSFSSSAVPIKFVTTAKSWKEIVDIAKQTNKKIFVDVYTSWCAPCKKMDLEVFNESTVSEFYNTNFINVKIDAEKEWGVEFSKSNQINAYPTYLFFSPTGKVAFTALGYTPAKSFLEIGKTVLTLSTNNTLINAYADRYASGSYDANMVYNYIKTAGPIPHNRYILLEKYLSMLPDEALATDLVQRLIYTSMSVFIPSSFVHKALLAAYQKYPVKNGLLTSPWNVLRSKILEGVETAGKAKDLAYLNQLILVNLPLEKTEYAKIREELFLKCIYYANAGEVQNFQSTFLKFRDQAIVSADNALLYETDKNEFKVIHAYAPPNHSPEQLKTSLRSESYRTINDLLSILFFYKSSPKLATIAMDSEIKKSMLAAIDLYKRNPIHAIPFVITQAEKSIANY